MSRKKIFLLITIIFILIFAYPFASNWIKDLSTEYEEVKAVSKDYQKFIVSTGKVEAINNLYLSFKEAGTVSSIKVSPGEEVKKGQELILLEQKELLADINAQKQKVNRETAKLSSFVDGPGEIRSRKIETEVELARSLFESELLIAHSSIRESGGNIEGLVRGHIDTLFNGSLVNPKYEGDVAYLEKRKLELIRRSLELVFNRWNSESDSSNINISKIESFYKDLEVINKNILIIYNTVLPNRKLNEDNEKAFQSITALRDRVLSETVSVARTLKSVKNQKLQYDLKEIQSKEELVGGTPSQKSAQLAQVNLEKETLKKLEQRLEDTKIIAPYDGVVGEILASTGEYVNHSNNAIRFISTGGFNISSYITEVEIQKINIGDEMTAVVQATGDKIKLTTSSIDATENLQDSVPTYEVIFDVASGIDGLRQGLSVDVYLPVEEEREVIVIPKDAVTKERGKNYINRKINNTYTREEVILGVSIEGGLVEVQGLNEGDLVRFVKE